MAQILIRGLPDAVVKRLKARAKRNGRSLTGEVRTILAGAGSMAPEPQLSREEALRAIDRFRRKYADRRFTDGVGLLREARAEREGRS